MIKAKKNLRQIQFFTIGDLLQTDYVCSFLNRFMKLKSTFTVFSVFSMKSCVTKNLISEVHIALQAMLLKLIKRDRKGQNVFFNYLD